MNVFEPVTLLSNLAGATERIGLGGTVSTSFSEPYNVARQFASLDHLSAGRAGWNVVTSANDFAARNFGHAALAPHDERYARAQEFVKVVLDLWDSWDDGAYVRDRASGMFFDPATQHKLTHRGQFFNVEGALNIERSPQGKPVIIQAGASETGKEFAAETAEVVFASNSELGRAAAFYADLKGRMAKYGRQPDELKVLAGLPIIVGESVQEAQDKYQALQELIHPDVGRLRLGMDLELDLSDLPLDEPIPEELIPRTSNLHQMYFNRIVEMIRTEKLTLRQLYMRYERGNKTLCGTVGMIADHMEEWLTAEAADGFMLTFPTLPDGLEAFVAEGGAGTAAPRHLPAPTMRGTTLRDHLGLARPGQPLHHRCRVPAPPSERREHVRRDCRRRYRGAGGPIRVVADRARPAVPAGRSCWRPCVWLLSLSVQDAAGAFSLGVLPPGLPRWRRTRACSPPRSGSRSRPRCSAWCWGTRSPFGWRGGRRGGSAALTLLVLFPFWTSALVKSFIWLVLLGHTGPLARVFEALGVRARRRLLFDRSDGGARDGAHHAAAGGGEHAADHRRHRPLAWRWRRRRWAPPGRRRFGAITFQLSMPGVAAAGLLVFIGSLGFYITPALLGGPHDTMLGQVIIQQILSLQNWSFAGALAAMLVGSALARLPGVRHGCSACPAWAGGTSPRRIGPVDSRRAGLFGCWRWMARVHGCDRCPA